MKRYAKAVLILLSTITAIAVAQSSTNDPGAAQGTQARGYWIDPSTKLMWAGKDNGKDVSWKKAMKYCEKLRLAGYADWMLATLPELAQIYDSKVESPGLMGPSGRGESSTWHVKGGLFLTGDEWSSERIYDDRGHPSGYDWYFDFNEGRSNNEPSGFPYSSSGKRALCVRGPDK